VKLEGMWQTKRGIGRVDVAVVLAAAGFVVLSGAYHRASTPPPTPTPGTGTGTDATPAAADAAERR
jgi:FlaG/FlaF family flagellin (archaellin)